MRTPILSLPASARLWSFGALLKMMVSPPGQNLFIKALEKAVCPDTRSTSCWTLIYQYGKRHTRWTVFRSEHLFDRYIIINICAQPVDGIGWVRHYAAVTQDCNRLLDLLGQGR